MTTGFIHVFTFGVSFLFWPVVLEYTSSSWQDWI